MTIFSELKKKAIWSLLALLVLPLTGLAAEHPILPLGSAARTSLCREWMERSTS